MDVLQDEPVDHVGEVGGEELDVPELPVVVEGAPAPMQHDRQGYLPVDTTGVYVHVVCSLVYKCCPLWAGTFHVRGQAVVQAYVGSAGQEVVQLREVVEKGVDDVLRF